MKNLRLTELLLLSNVEKTAKRVTFNPKITVFVGENDTGKSSLLKSIYHCFGAEPAITHERWPNLKVIELVKFTVDSIPYSILRDGRFFAVFNAEDQLIFKTNKVTAGIGLYLADLLDFQLLLSTPNAPEELITPPPAFLFLPFYVDQDKGWTSAWSSFSKLSQFKNWRKDVSAYHLGLTTNEYYKTKSLIQQSQSKLGEANSQIQILRDVRDTLTQQISNDSFAVDINDFKEESEILVMRCQALKAIQDDYRAKLLDLKDYEHSLKSQSLLARASLQEISKDYKFAAKQPDEVKCPTCGTIHENSFTQRFSIAQDEDNVRELVTSLDKELSEVEEKIENLAAGLDKTKAEVALVEDSLSQKRGRVELRDVIASEGRINARNVLNRNIESHSKIVESEQNNLTTAKKTLRALEKNNRTNREAITSFFTDRMRRYCSTLDVNTIGESAYSDINGYIKETGSDLPRALLAYYFTVLHTSKNYGSSARCPIILDSINQGAQDSVSLLKMLKFVFDEQPEDSQLILGLEDDLGLAPAGSKVVLNTKYRLMNEEDYASVSLEVMPRLQIALADDK